MNASWSPLQPYGCKGGKQHRGAKHSARGSQHRKPSNAPREFSSSRAKLKRKHTLTVRCRSTEPANTHNPITTHTHYVRMPQRNPARTRAQRRQGRRANERTESRQDKPRVACQKPTTASCLPCCYADRASPKQAMAGIETTRACR